MIQIELINEGQLNAPAAAEFEQWLAPLSAKLQATGEVCIKIIDADESQYLNQTYRGKDRPTNVLSFPSEIPDFVDSDHLGDLAICMPIVTTEAEQQNKPLKHHWAHMMIHGVLHLLGYDHIEEDEADEMEALEVEILAHLEIPNPYQ
ncbi:rRNA maturation RNase YbeY [Marinicella sp. S1101]|uniref:rRNA maturation RNase YbeY n=1 Tax=Marinicella marina TaxID=2996016 RepID=UPI002260B301|nr:rRNA maturation RNase YbeY [Marinicella marina]MCX7554416.1 rRNA maturation RNase YbeY [Marinicella marina]MDJ1140567.1 rRNA maturation RNase YbeY [Marinicella marina]